jgi:hypothetical protein
VNLPVMIFSYPAFKFMGLRSSLPLPHWYGIDSLPSFSFYSAHVIMQRSSLTGRKMFEMLAVFSAGRLLYLKFYSTSYLRILYSIGDTGRCTPNGYTSMSTASTTSTSLHL